MTADADADFGTVVYDLDGTLVRLAVDWDAVTREAAEAFADAGIEVDDDLFAMFDAAQAYGLGDELEGLVSDHECRGAERSERLPSCDRLATHEGRVGVCSLNSERACRLALERHGVLEYVDAIVGRDSVAGRKPDPEPLLSTLRRLDADPADAVFVGDTERDAETADRAGVAFRYVDGTPRKF
ncbi:MAG: HAD family hydrolase [Haloplanus sp.]